MRTPHATVRAFWHLWLSLAACAALPATSLAQSLLDFVGDETGFCLHLERVPAWSESLESSAFVRRLEQTPLIRNWKAGRDFDQMRQNLVQLELLLGGPLDRVLRETIGRELVLAVDPKAPGQPAGILLTAPTNRSTVDRVLGIWNRIEEATTTELSGGYVQRTVGRQPPVYYYLRDDLFAISDRESLIREIAATDRGGEVHPRPLSASPEWSRARGSLSAPAWGTVYFRPRLWEGVLPRESNAPVVGPVLRELARAESLIFGLDGESGLHWELSVQFVRGELPAVLRAESGHPEATSRDWPELSNGTLLAVAGRGGPNELATWIREAIPNKNLREWRVVRQFLRGLLLDRDPLDDVLPRLGPDWGVRIVDDPGAAAIPLGMMATLEFRPGPDAEPAGEPRAELSKSLDHFLKTSLQIVAAQLDPEASDPAELQVETLAPGVTLRWLEGLPWVRPACVVTTDRVLVSTSPDLLKPIVAGRRSDSVETAISSRSRIGAARQVVFFNVRATRSFLMRHREELPGWLQVPPGETARAVEAFRQVEETLAAVDEAYFALSIVDDGLRIRGGLQVDAD